MIQIRIANPPKDLTERFLRYEKDFYFKYAEIVRSILMTTEVQEFIELVIGKESIDLNRIKDTRVMVFPYGSTEFERKHAKQSAINIQEIGCSGTYDSTRGVISIYPIMVNPPQSAIRFLENEKVLAGITLKVLAAFIEEVLHAKYNNEYMKKRGWTRVELERETGKIADHYLNEFVKLLGKNKECSLN